MPGFNRQGPPNGQGNQSGRRLGKCNPANKNAENQENDEVFGYGQGRGFGRGQGNGMGRGRGNGFGNHGGGGRGRGMGRGRI